MKQLVNLNNKYRVVLTEVLPYETPFLFSNRNYYENLKQDGVEKWFCGHFSMKNHSKPFEYSIHRRGGKKSRSLCIIHPCEQINVSSFYQKYGEYLLYLNKLSPFSLRHIDSVRRSIFVDDTDGNKFQSYDSFFEYADYDREYKFFESARFLRLEQKYQFLRRLDIGQCFYHIYTHSFAWAIKGKEAIKDSLGINEKPCTCETEFDTLMMSMNYRETNGIVVGPEFSRIFAEVIFQRVDLNVLSKLKQEYNLVYGQHYEIKRYVDDYFVFSYKESILDIIEKVLEEELEPYRLYLNESKKDTNRRPFPNHIASAKDDLSQLYDQYSDKWKHGDTFKGKEREDFQSFVNKIREVAVNHKVEFENLVRYLLSLLSKTLEDIASIISKGSPLNVDVLLNIAEISLYVYSLDMNPSSSYKICKILQTVHEISKKENEATIEVEQLLKMELKRILDIYINDYDVTNTNIEVLNILLLMEREGIMEMDFSFISRLFPHKDKDHLDWNRINYFHICTLLYLFKDKPQYEDVRKELIKHVNSIFYNSKEKNLSNSELVLLLIDIVSCPYIDYKIKNDLLIKALGVNAPIAGKIRSKLESYKTWFFDWTGSITTRDYLYMKEAHSPY